MPEVLKQAVRGTPVAALLLAFAGSAQAQSVAVPKSFELCAACHSMAAGEHVNGPSLAKLINRQAGSVESFRYSGPMKRSGLVWDAQTLRKFLTDPQATVPGNRMPFSGMDNPAQVTEVLDYLIKAAR